MPLDRRNLLKAGAAGLAAAWGAPWLAAGAAAPAFRPSWASLQQYQVPDWFRDAKFGIWAHWSAQCVPERGDWYARLMYLQGTPFYDYHVKTYGHPSRFGFMEIDDLWKAERWEPEQLMKLYRKAGAKYFVALANHHDNFDTYDSSHHDWNSLRIGPKKDIIGTWAPLARDQGLRFGVSVHAAHAWHWFQVAYGYDGEGPLAGVRYDAARLTKADGKGQWWEGLDPQELYTGPSMIIPEGIRGIQAVQDWHARHDGVWTERAPPHNPQFVRKWSLRCRDLIDKYHPDLVYFDDSELPLGQAGLDMAAYYYNASLAWNDGRLEAVINGKKLKPQQRSALVEDVERGYSDSLRPLPWQSDTCIGNWHYDRELYLRHGYKSAASVIARLCDVVSKNGNLLLSVPMRGDGSIDDDELAILGDLGTWMAVNGEAIYGTRPWTVYGEGPTRVKQGMFGEAAVGPFTAQDIRFTTGQGHLYALVLAPLRQRSLSIRSLAGHPGNVERVELLGAPQPLGFRRDEQGLSIDLPENIPAAPVNALRISGRGLV